MFKQHPPSQAKKINHHLILIMLMMIYILIPSNTFFKKEGIKYTSITIPILSKDYTFIIGLVIVLEIQKH